jgi:DNA-binding NarL/FixJ family response regulator
MGRGFAGGDCYRELLRISLPRTPVNKDKRREIITDSSAGALLKSDMSAIRIVRVMLVEDHIAFRQSLASLLSRESDLEVVAQAGSLAEARQMLDAPLDVAVIDLSLPDGDGRDLIGELRHSNAGISVLVLTVMLGPGHLDEVMKAGADAVLHKVASPTTIVEEVRRLADG